ncbi:hypothetical protein I79_009978 [Cricetulus griseus]|uniref:Uncharacterized protein n=1 Tax=Cricetulus griseus TaxID=10029 RepID=G3HH80_CRIGR|nr:hypothetical protein I79_009978 [Cricetulus griseus]
MDETCPEIPCDCELRANAAFLVQYPSHSIPEIQGLIKRLINATCSPGLLT